MSDPLKIAVLATLTGVLLLGMAFGWRRRTVRGEHLVPELAPVPALGAPRVGPLEATYLATAPAEDRLARVAAHRLGVRAAAVVEVHDAGVLVRRVGAQELFLPADTIRAVTRASGMAGTAVGRDRVVVLRWRLGDVTLDTGLLPRHPDDAARLVDAIGTNAADDNDGATTEGSGA